MVGLSEANGELDLEDAAKIAAMAHCEGFRGSLPPV